MASAEDVTRWQGQLTDVRGAIRAIETHGQAYSLDGNALQITRANLPELYSRERELERRIARASRGGMRT